MKKLFFVVLVLLCLGWAVGFLMNNEDETKGKVADSFVQEDLKARIDSAKMLTYTDKTFKVMVPYPDFFEASDTMEPGTARFYYPNKKDRRVTLTMFVESNVEGWNIKEAVEHLSDSSTICIDSNDYYYIMRGKLESPALGLYLEKCFLINDMWIDYAIYYGIEHEEEVERLMKMIMEWEPLKE